MKKILSSVLVIVAWMILPMTLWADELWVVSDTSTKVFYNGPTEKTSIKPTKGPAGWNSDPDFEDAEENNWFPASLYQHAAYLIPTATPPFDESGAEWISYSESGNGPDSDLADGSRGVYLYRQTFQLPGVAYIINSDAAIASDNYGWLYINGKKVLGPRDRSEAGLNFESPPSTGTIPAGLLACNNVLAAEIQNGCGDCDPTQVLANGANGPTGTIFSLTLNYEVPKVEWEPPVTNSDVRKNGSTLPLKFRFYAQDWTLVKEVQHVSLAVYGPATEQGIGDQVIQWTLGNSVRNMRFSKGNGQYIANFQTNKMNLDDGTYTAVVLDGCTDVVLGSIEFELAGKKKEKDPKPPKPKK